VTDLTFNLCPFSGHRNFGEPVGEAVEAVPRSVVWQCPGKTNWDKPRENTREVGRSTGT
jgi:hypothetical protein